MSRASSAMTPILRITRTAAVLPDTFSAVWLMSMKASTPAMIAIASTGRPVEVSTVAGAIAALSSYQTWVVSQGMTMRSAPALVRRSMDEAGSAMQPVHWKRWRPLRTAGRSRSVQRQG